MTATYTSVPVATNLVNVFDYFGMLMGLPRLPGEKNTEYRARLWDVYVKRAGAHEEGLINGITRELGLSQFNAITVSSSSPNSPRVIVRDTQIELYSNWIIDANGDQDYTLDETIDIYSKDSSSYFLPGLISTINTSTYFTAVAVDSVDNDTLSATILNQNSRKWQENEIIKPLFRIDLENDNLINGTLTFSFEGRNVYSSEVASEVLVVAAGDYYVDYTNGFLVSYSLPAGTVSCRYMYDAMPITLKASPVILHEFGSEQFRNLIFDQVEQPDGTYTDGLPLHDAVDMVQELISAVPFLWGR
jgi:hypothetical protein